MVTSWEFLLNELLPQLLLWCRYAHNQDFNTGTLNVLELLESISLASLFLSSERDQDIFTAVTEEAYRSEEICPMLHSQLVVYPEPNSTFLTVNLSLLPSHYIAKLLTRRRIKISSVGFSLLQYEPMKQTIKQRNQLSLGTFALRQLFLIWQILPRVSTQTFFFGNQNIRKEKIFAAQFKSSN